MCSKVCLCEVVRGEQPSEGGGMVSEGAKLSKMGRVSHKKSP